MTRCRDFEAQLSLYVDDQLDAPAADVVRSHVDTCAHCAGLLSDFTRLSRAARLLGPLDPPARVYTALAAELAAPQGQGTPPAAARPFWAWAGAAAVLLVALGGAYLAGGGSLRSSAPPAGALADTHSLDAAASELELAVHHYERAIAELETAASATGLDPDVAQVVRSSLGALDRAILESRQAVATNPASEPARISLFEALRRKIDLLQATALIVHEHHNVPAGASRPVEGAGREL